VRCNGGGENHYSFVSPLCRVRVVIKNDLNSDRKAEELLRSTAWLFSGFDGNQLGVRALDRLRELTTAFGFSVVLGDLSYLENGWYVTHAGLLRLASR
jgi:hypothetical protein